MSVLLSDVAEFFVQRALEVNTKEMARDTKLESRGAGAVSMGKHRPGTFEAMPRSFNGGKTKFLSIFPWMKTDPMNPPKSFLPL